MHIKDQRQKQQSSVTATRSAPNRCLKWLRDPKRSVRNTECNNKLKIYRQRKMQIIKLKKKMSDECRQKWKLTHICCYKYFQL